MARGSASVIGGLLAIGAIGVGGYLAYKYFVNPNPSEDCSGMPPRCNNGVSQVCLNKVWVSGGDACPSDIPCHPNGAMVCDTSYNGAMCIDGYWEDDPTICGGQYDCSALDCRSWRCGSGQPSDYPTTTYIGNPLRVYDPSAGGCTCQYQNIIPNQVSCAQRRIPATGVAVTFNNRPPLVNGIILPYDMVVNADCWDLWVEYMKAAPVVIRVDVKDTFGQPYQDLPLVIGASAPYYGAFRSLAPWNNGTEISCTGASLITDANGHAETEWHWTWDAGSSKAVEITVHAIDEAGTDRIVRGQINTPKTGSMLAQRTCTSRWDYPAMDGCRP